ncbi:uncharacterized protein LOC135949517 [Calliphora vicina]|uniref:uncharacterized protein LOC135949517 n=1 Tax=Calliphora vicina TaxID=7373 RepID=UPI00325B97C6
MTLVWHIPHILSLDREYHSQRTTTNERSPLSSAPKQNNCVEDNIKEIIEKQTTTQMVAEKSNATVINVTNSSNENINSIKTGDDKQNQSSFTLKNTGAIPKNSIVKNTGKILTGMDRHITITKRKSSPRTSILEPNPKQAKKNPVSQNRFAILDNHESKEKPAKPVKDYKPPPLYLREPTTNVLVNKLSQLVGN